MDPRDFLAVASDWAVGVREAEWRSAISRAYFAAFHVARGLLQQVGFTVPRGEQVPAYLWLRLTNSGHPDVQQAGADLNELRRVRNWADYDLDRPVPQDTARDATQVGDAIIQLLDLLSTTPTVLTQVTAAMRDYERDVLREVTWRP